MLLIFGTYVKPKFIVYEHLGLTYDPKFTPTPDAAKNNTFIFCNFMLLYHTYLLLTELKDMSGVKLKTYHKRHFKKICLKNMAFLQF